MATTRHRHETESSKPRGGCDCGCGGDEPVESICCGLDCLVQPRFFCGQLLSDVDLKALLRWTKDKARLARYRDGWGVVCGLDVHRDLHKPSGVTVGPGYAVSCCGDDIVVCEEEKFDLSGACGSETDPCLDPVRYAKERSGGNDEAADGGKPWVNGCPPTDAWCAVDLYIRFAEEPSDPQTALRRGACDQLGRCEYSRTRERFTLDWKPVTEQIDTCADDWRRRFCDCRCVIDRFRSERSAYFTPLDERIKKLEEQLKKVEKTNSEAAEQAKKEIGATRDTQAAWVRDWLAEQTRMRRLHQFGFLGDAIRGYRNEDLLDDAEVSWLLLWLVQDCRSKVLRSACPSCNRDDGVRLARVRLAPAATGTPAQRQIAFIDTSVRRPLDRDHGLPAPTGYRNLGSLIWQTENEASDTLKSLGYRVNSEAVQLSNSKDLPAMDELSRVLGYVPFVSRTSASVTINVVPFCDQSNRVVAIRDDDEARFACAPCASTPSYDKRADR